MHKHSRNDVNKMHRSKIVGGNVCPGHKIPGIMLMVSIMILAIVAFVAFVALKYVCRILVVA